MDKEKMAALAFLSSIPGQVWPEEADPIARAKGIQSVMRDLASTSCPLRPEMLDKHRRWEQYWLLVRRRLI